MCSRGRATGLAKPRQLLVGHNLQILNLAIFVIARFVSPSPLVTDLVRVSKQREESSRLPTFPFPINLSTPFTPSPSASPHLTWLRIICPRHGRNRGLGQALVQRFLAQPNRIVIAANRDPQNATSKELSNLPRGEGSKLIVLKYDATVEQDAFSLVKQLREEHGIDRLDIVVANAGIMKSYPLVIDVKRAEIMQHIEVNTFGVVWLYQATRELLQKSPNGPIFAPMGSGAGTLSRQPPVPNAAYGPSKAMLHWYGVRINAENDWLTSFILDPGFVQTESGNIAARGFGMEEATLTVDESVDGVFRLLNTATKETFGGKVVLYTGEVQEW